MGFPKEWERQDVSGEASTVQNMQALGEQKLGKIWIEKRITHIAYYDVDRQGKDKKLRWVGGLILYVSDGNWLVPGARTRCYTENEAAYVLWDEVQEADCSIFKSLETFKEHKFNKTREGAWNKQDEIDYVY